MAKNRDDSDEERISLGGVGFEEAVRDLLATSPPEERKKKKAKRRQAQKKKGS